MTACFFGHIHEEECFALAGTKFITTASLNWNFPNESKSEADRGDFGGYRVVRVLETSIAHKFRLTHGLTEFTNLLQGWIIIDTIAEMG